jgi:hypothetical protein
MVRVVDRVDAVGFRVNATTDDDDPRPEPPAPPDADACCGSGCSPCVFDVYEDARERYLEMLRAWQERQTRRTPQRTSKRSTPASHF